MKDFRIAGISDLTIQTLELKAPWGWTRHVKVERTSGKDKITWDQLQAVKNYALGPDAAAVEFFPPENDLVNETNMRHLWEIPTDWLPLHRS